jgi:hypothetical protein
MSESTSAEKMAPPSQAAGKPLSAAARAAARLEIERIRLVQFSAMTGYGAFESLPDRIQPRVGFTRPSVERKDKRLCITTTFMMRILPAEKPEVDRLPAFDLRATVELLYRIAEDGELDDDAIDEFARVNAPFNAWPYWRELVQSAQARLSLPLTPLPLFRISDAASLTIEENTFDAGSSPHARDS